mmetsp:Transcript_36800/g.117179  ORF Transcript_36800/g.117179 Transcript_36800/m.117179 type:complete len:362 (+) Transcript_36800:815-1900(+)
MQPGGVGQVSHRGERAVAGRHQPASLLLPHRPGVRGRRHPLRHPRRVLRLTKHDPLQVARGELELLLGPRRRPGRPLLGGRALSLVLPPPVFLDQRPLLRPLRRAPPLPRLVHQLYQACRLSRLSLFLRPAHLPHLLQRSHLVRQLPAPRAQRRLGLGRHLHPSLRHRLLLQHLPSQLAQRSRPRTPGRIVSAYPAPNAAHPAHPVQLGVDLGQREVRQLQLATGEERPARAPAKLPHKLPEYCVAAGVPAAATPAATLAFQGGRAAAAGGRRLSTRRTAAAHFALLPQRGCQLLVPLSGLRKPEIVSRLLEATNRVSGATRALPVPLRLLPLRRFSPALLPRWLTTPQVIQTPPAPPLAV